MLSPSREYGSARGSMGEALATLGAIVDPRLTLSGRSWGPSSCNVGLKQRCDTDKQDRDLLRVWLGYNLLALSDPILPLHAHTASPCFEGRLFLDHVDPQDSSGRARATTNHC